MGLGKTLQMLALIAHAREAGETRPFLVVAPTSVLSTWRSEAARFTPGLRVAVVDATRAKRGIDGDGCRGLRRSRRHLVHAAPPRRAASSRRWSGRGSSSTRRSSSRTARPRRYRAARDLRADVTLRDHRHADGEQPHRAVGAALAHRARAVPVGAPVPRASTSARSSRARCPRTRRAATIAPAGWRGCDAASARWCCAARRSSSPPTCRRSRSRRCGSSSAPAHRALYDTVLQRERQKVLGLLDDLDRNRFIVFRSLTLLRMLSLAPELVDPANAHIAPSKLDALFEQLDEILAEGHRTLVFSQFTSFLGTRRRRGSRSAASRTPTSTARRAIGDAAIASFRGGRRAGVPHQPQGRRVRAHPHRGRLRVPARPVVEPGRASRRPSTARTASARRGR